MTTGGLDGAVVNVHSTLRKDMQPVFKFKQRACV
jgi:hypothetical protein